eukprot:scaffold116023_cov63-Phaeocystis_antarctica.AAC.4
MHTPQARCGRSLATFLALQAVICQILYLRTASLAALTVSLPCTTGAFALAFGLARRASRAPHAAQHVAKRSPCERQRPGAAEREQSPCPLEAIARRRQRSGAFRRSLTSPFQPSRRSTAAWSTAAHEHVLAHRKKKARGGARLFYAASAACPAERWSLIHRGARRSRTLAIRIA